MICKVCNHIRNIDLCRDSHMVSDGKEAYVANKFAFADNFVNWYPFTFTYSLPLNSLHLLFWY